MKRKVGIVIDTNLWVSWLIKKRETRLSQVFSDSSLEIVSSHEQAVELYKVKISVDVSRDKKDNFLLALAKTAQANYLLTGDKDLLVIEKFAGANIITLTEFLNEK